MDYSALIQQLQAATGFDLYRLHTAIGRMLDDPERIAEVKRRVHPGDEVGYFDASQNRLVKARLLGFKRTRVVVRNIHDGQEWSLPYDFDQLTGETRLLFEHGAAQTHFGCSLFWIRRLAAFDGEQAAVEHWQTKRDGTQRGVVEVTGEA